jgi:hypothetical protein
MVGKEEIDTMMIEDVTEIEIDIVTITTTITVKWTISNGV